MSPQRDDDEMVRLSQYYPDGIIDQFVLVPEQGAVENVKPRRRRRKNKSNDGSGGGEGLMRKRKLREDQVIMLEKSFGSEHKLETERKDQLAAELGLDPRQVAVWFQNRRARWRSKKLEEEYNKLRREHESTVVEKCRLEAEILKIKEQLNEAEKEIERLSEQRCDALASNNPSASWSMDTYMEPPFLKLGMKGLENLFYLPEDNFVHSLQWDNNIYY